MKRYKLLNNVIGWSVFVFASAVYLMTIEPTASWWDCGEYISTAVKLEVGHPPGAPTFQILGRFFSLFAFGNHAREAAMVNSMSALMSGFTILFLFWTITAFAKKIALRSGEINPSKMMMIFGSGVVGALAYTFSDSFWFSAVEGEVYASSSFYTAIVFWAMLKWEEVADKTYAWRWIVLISFLVGLSIGVHLLNLLTIPAMAFIYYFRKHKPTTKGIIYTAIISFLLLALVMNGIIPQVVNLAGKFELFFVNTVGLPFNSGTIIYFLVILAAILLGLNYTRRKKKVVANTAILSFAFLLIGYSSFLMLVIRSNANTPINENNPKDAISLLSYLNREQYGDWPILYGQYFNAPLDKEKPYKDGNPLYRWNKEKKKYVVIDDRKESVPNYDSRFMTLFPRMWSAEKQSHINAYKDWGKIKGIPIEVTKPDGKTEVVYKPTFGENLRFFFTYQVGHMYLRYFMWNFAGRQNDVEGYGTINEGNWISGIPFIDDTRLGPQENVPENQDNRANNKLYFLPLILGLIGLFYHARRDYKDTLVVALLFFMTGLAIILYLNQTPYQPRERDYAYVGSFYAFAIWIGLGVMGLAEALGKKMKPLLAGALVTLASLILVPGIMGAREWDDHDRSHKYACRDFAADYLNSCAPNAILFTNGDNDTFPLWYAQEVEGIRTDVRVVNFMLASGDWYIHQLAHKIYDSDYIPFTLSQDMYETGTNDYVPVYERTTDTLNLKDVIDFIKSDNPDAKITMSNGRDFAYVPTKHLYVDIDTAGAVKKGIVPRRLAGKMVNRINWNIKKSYLYKNDLMLYDLLATGGFNRPIYFANPTSMSNVLDVDKYCHLEGFVYRFMPVPAEHYYPGAGGINTEDSYNILMNKCAYGNLNRPDVYVDRESYRNSMIPKITFMRLAQALIEEGKKDKAVKAMDKCFEMFPNAKMNWDNDMAGAAEVYYSGGAPQKANAFLETLLKNLEIRLKYYQSVPFKDLQYFDRDRSRTFSILRNLADLTKRNGQEALSKKILAMVETYAPAERQNQ